MIDDALSLLVEMKRNSLHAGIVLYNVCIDCLWMAGKMDMTWKHFHPVKALGRNLDYVTYTSMLGVICKDGRINENHILMGYYNFVIMGLCHRLIARNFDEITQPA